MSIVIITDKAKSQITSIFQNEDPNKGLRLSVVGGGCSGLNYKMDFDQSRDTDNVIDVGNIKILIDPKSSIYLKGVVLDYQDGLQGKGFVFKNPNATNTCGCGESFSV